MCIFQRFWFLCDCESLKISRTCNNTSVNAQNQTFCRHDPHPHLDDGNTTRQYDPDAYGPGVCSNVHCRWKWGLLPFGMYDEDVEERYGPGSTPSVYEDSTAFDMSEAARREREERWFQMLNPRQRVEFRMISYPLVDQTLSLYAQAWFSQGPLATNPVIFDRCEEYSTDQLRWHELNPRYMSSRQLHHATGMLLPASVTIPGNANLSGSMPLKPFGGPFKVYEHTCEPNPGSCIHCGRNLGDEGLVYRQLDYEGDVLMWGGGDPRRRRLL